MIVLLAHGSRDARHREGIERLAAQVAIVAPDDNVGHAYFDFHGPDLATAVSAAERGETVLVLPLLMSAGVHLREDVPAAVRSAQSDRHDLVWRLLAPLPVSRLATVVTQYLRAQDVAVRRELVLVPAGSTRAGALTGIDDLARGLAASRSVGVRVANGVDDLALSRRPSAGPGEAWLPVMYADGRLLDSLRRRATGCGAEVLPPLGSLPGVAVEIASWLAADLAEPEDSSGSPG